MASATTCTRSRSEGASEALSWAFLACVFAAAVGLVGLSGLPASHHHPGEPGYLFHSHFHTGAHGHSHEEGPAADLGDEPSQAPPEDPAEEPFHFAAHSWGPPLPSAPVALLSSQLRPAPETAAGQTLEIPEGRVRLLDRPRGPPFPPSFSA